MLTPTGAPWVIVGCGYTGERLAARLGAAGATVVATTRRPERAGALARLPGVAARVADPHVPASLDGMIPRGAIVVDSVPPERERPTHVRALVAAAAAAGARRIVYLSSTGVYGRGAGEWVDEDTPPAGDTPRGRARLDAEAALAAGAEAAGLEAVALRVAAIYGPGRGVHERLRAGTYRVIGDGANWVSRIHVDDLVGAIIAAGTVAPLGRRVYVIADDEPATARAHADGVAALLGLPPPASIPESEVPPEHADFLFGNRRVRNARLKAELGVVLRHPTWREGVPASLV